MATTPITLCSNALVLLGDSPIASFEDGSTGSTVSALLYQTTYESMLTETRWHFATRKAKLAQLLEKPLNSWMYKYQLPSDCLYVVKCDDRNYEIYERELYCNSKTAEIDYVYPVKEENLPMYFTKALEYNLASQFAIPITSNTSRAEFFRALYLDAIKKARFADASQRPNDSIDSSPYVRVRMN